MNQKTPSINLKELSYLTGFSVSTVSKALNDKIDISTKTKKIVMGVAQKHNYVPNSFAVGLRNNRSYTIAAILPQVNTDLYGDILYYFQKTADRLGYRIVVFQSFGSEIKEIQYLKSICDGSIDGAILITEKENTSYSDRYSIPVLSIPTVEVKGAENLEKFSHAKFEKFLFEIN